MGSGIACLRIWISRFLLRDQGSGCVIFVRLQITLLVIGIKKFAYKKLGVIDGKIYYPAIMASSLDRLLPPEKS